MDDQTSPEPLPERNIPGYIRSRAVALGFDLVGFAPAEPSAHRGAFLQWLAAGYHADMAYVARDPEKRLDIRLWEPTAKSVIVVAANYYYPILRTPDMAWIARYALGDDYHVWLKQRLRQLGNDLSSRIHGPFTWRPFVDTAPVLERELAVRAGLGWIGKNGMLINPNLGSYLLLGGIAVSAVLPYNQPMRPHCGTCTRCMEACPTGAIVRPGVVDARRCIAYHTIESRTWVPEYVARAMGNRIFGCDLCQEACPMNREPGRSSRPNLVPTSDPSRMPRPELSRLDLAALSRMTDDDIRRVLRGTAVLRARPERLRAMAATAVRNAPPAQYDS